MLQTRVRSSTPFSSVVGADGSTARHWPDDGVGQVFALPLTERERQVLALVAEGWSNKLVAAHLVISERTVKNHLTNIMGKLQASDRTHAVVTAVRLGWLAI